MMGLQDKAMFGVTGKHTVTISSSKGPWVPLQSAEWEKEVLGLVFNNKTRRVTFCMLYIGSFDKDYKQSF